MSLTREIRSSLGLGDETEDQVLLLAFKTMMEKAAEADRLRDELEKLHSEADRRPLGCRGAA